MWPDRVSNPGPLTYESGALPIALRGPAWFWGRRFLKFFTIINVCHLGYVTCPGYFFFLEKLGPGTFWGKIFKPSED